MTAPHASPPARDHLLESSVDVGTPELVTISFAVAGIGSRGAAALIDGLLVLVLLMVLNAVGIGSILAVGGQGGAVALAILLLLQFGVFWGYFVLFEWLNDGQTPGKRWLGLRVVQDGGFSLTFANAAVRNLLRLVDAHPGLLYGVGIVSTLVSSRGKRLSDLVAGTIVVRERTAVVPSGALARAAQAPSSTPGAPLLDDEAFALVERLVASVRRTGGGPMAAARSTRAPYAYLSTALAIVCSCMFDVPS